MNPEKRELYNVVWTQTYPAKPIQDMAHEFEEQHVEEMLENSDFLEAMQVITRAKKG